MINGGGNQNLLPHPLTKKKKKKKGGGRGFRTMPLYVNLFLLIVLSAAFQRFVFQNSD